MAPRTKSQKTASHRRKLVTADWVFIDPDKYSPEEAPKKKRKGAARNAPKVISKDVLEYNFRAEEKCVLFRYELAREAVHALEKAEQGADRDIVANRWMCEFGLMGGIFPNYFPKVAYLDIEPVERRTLWREAFLEGGQRTSC